jgi:hypothetical protein
MTTTKKKKSGIKKFFKYTFFTFLFFLIVLISAPFIFKDKIVKMVVNGINENINATLSYQDTDISFFKNFPELGLEISEIVIKNKEPFLGDTLFAANTLFVTMKFSTLFQKEEKPVELLSFGASNGKINILFNNDDIGNYDILLKKSTDNDSLNKGISLDINQYELKNIKFHYFDAVSKNKLVLDSIYHTGSGNFKNDIFTLETASKAQLSVAVNEVNYIKNIAITLDALMEIDVKNLKFTFKENKGFINQLPLEFDGFIQKLEDSQLYDLHFKTPTSSFKNAIAIFPKELTGDLKSIETDGNFELKGDVKGTLSETTIPTFNISILSEKAMFKYASLPKAVKNISINTNIINTTGFAKDTQVAINNASFTIDKDVFSLSGNASNFSENIIVNLKANGIINLANIKKVYPLSIQKDFEGILKASINTSFDMNSVEKKQYQNIKNSGEISVTNFKYQGEEVAKPFYISQTSVNFTNNTIKLKNFDAKTGSSDISLTGNLENFYGFLFDDQELKGAFLMNSNLLKVSDFLDESSKEEKNKSALKIPSFLNISITGAAKTVDYDQLILKNVSGKLLVKNESVRLENLVTEVFGGNIGLNGSFSTKENASNFVMDLNLKQLNISESFSQIEMLKSIAPIAKTLEGKLNSIIRVSGNLNEDMTPNLKTISGDLFGKLLNPKLNASNSKALSLLGEKLSFLDVSKLNLDGINAFLSFENGQVTVKPIPLKYNDIGIEIGGKHSFDNTMNYDIVFDVPVKYLGTEVTNLLSKLSAKDADQIKSIPIKATLKGSFSNPSFSSDLKQSTSNLINTLVAQQKQQLIDKGKDKLIDLIGENKKDTDTTKTTTKEVVKDKVKGVLTNIFGKKKDTTKKKND